MLFTTLTVEFAIFNSMGYLLPVAAMQGFVTEFYLLLPKPLIFGLHRHIHILCNCFTFLSCRSFTAMHRIMFTFETIDIPRRWAESTIWRYSQVYFLGTVQLWRQELFDVSL